MATRTIQVLIDDITNEEVPEVETVKYAVEGVGYEIDLAPTNKQKFLKTLVRYTERSRRTGLVKNYSTSTKGGGSGGQRGALAGMDVAQRTAIRLWWKRHQTSLGLPEFRTKGRVPEAVMEAYNR